ncbi:MAG: hypothetical protein ACRC3J_05520 [Culicoidibacterales bacterium]
MKTYQKLLEESMASGNIAGGRPTILAITRKTNKKLYKTLVAEQPTSQPRATVYGVRYLFETDKGDMVQDVLDDRSTGTGQYSFADDSLPVVRLDTDLTKYERFKYGNYKFETLVTGTRVTGATPELVYASLKKHVLTGKLRVITDSLGEEDQSKNIQQTKFIMERWRCDVKSRKVRTMATNELLRDMEGMGLDGEAAIEDLLATTLSADINTDIITKLITIASRYSGIGAKDGTVVIPLTTEKFNEQMYVAGNALVGIITQMSSKVATQTTFRPNWVLCSGPVGAILEASDLVEFAFDEETETNYSYIKSTGMRVVIDAKSFGDYIMVGYTGKAEDTLDTISPLYYAPYEQTDGGGTFTAMTVIDQESLQPAFGMMTRYALCGAPSDDGVKGPIDGEDWVELAGRSRLCMMCPVEIKES